MDGSLDSSSHGLCSVSYERSMLKSYYFYEKEDINIVELMCDCCGFSDMC